MLFKRLEIIQCIVIVNNRIQMCNDPTAGSPTVALLRLLFPLDHIVRIGFHR